MTDKSPSQKIPFLDLKTQYKTLQKEIDTGIKRVIQNCSFILGEECQAFEKEFSKHSGIDFIIGCGNGTDALSLALETLGIGPGDEIITTPFTWISTVETIAHRGAIPVFCDISLEDFTLDPEKISEKITPKTKAIVAVHLYGQPARMPEICSLAKEKNLKVIEDAAQAHDAKIAGQPIGTFGDAVTFSFYPGKNLGAYGDAGAIGTIHKDIDEKIRLLRNHGQKKKNDFLMLGYNSRLDGIQAAILRAKLPHLTQWTKDRQKCADFYRKFLGKTSQIILPNHFPKAQSVYHQFVIRTQKRDQLQLVLEENDIPTAIHYPNALHLTPAFKFLGHKKGDFPNAELASQEVLSLPCYPELSTDKIQYISEVIHTFFQ